MISSAACALEGKGVLAGDCTSVFSRDDTRHPKRRCCAQQCNCACLHVHESTPLKPATPLLASAVVRNGARDTTHCVARRDAQCRLQLKLALLCLVTGADAFAARSTVRRTTRLAAAADDFPRETARAAYSRFDDVCADEECDARELADDNGWDELRRLARREEAQDRAAAEKAAIAAFRARLEERWRE